jgi:thiamine biosynthesis lipoprotein
MSPYIESSELSQLNSHESDRAVPVSEELFALIVLSVELLVELAKEMEGAFDINFR